MTVKQAIEILSKLPPDGVLMVPSISHGGSVPLQQFENTEPGTSDPWIYVNYCDDEERANYGLPPISE